MPEFDALYAQYYRAVYARLRRLGVAPDEVDDLFQKVWLRAWQSLPRLKHDQNLGAWLWTITTNIVRDFQRLHKREHCLLEDAAALMDEHDPGLLVPEREARRDLVREIRQRAQARDWALLIEAVDGVPLHREDETYQARRNIRAIYRRTKARHARLEEVAV